MSMAQAPPTTFTYNGVTYFIDWRLFLTEQGGLTRADGRPITQEDRVNGGEWYNNVYIASFTGATPLETLQNISTLTPAKSNSLNVSLSKDTWLLIGGAFVLLLILRR